MAVQTAQIGQTWIITTQDVGTSSMALGTTHLPSGASVTPTCVISMPLQYRNTIVW